MSLVYANLCKVCHEHRTQNPSGICSKCRRLKGEQFCKICGTNKTSNESGICYPCSLKGFGAQDGKDRIDATIEDLKLTLYILERRKENESFAKIAEGCKLSKAACYARFMNACGIGNSIRGAAVDTIDQTVIDLSKQASKTEEK